MLSVFQVTVYMAGAGSVQNSVTYLPYSIPRTEIICKIPFLEEKPTLNNHDIKWDLVMVRKGTRLVKRLSYSSL